MKVLTSPTSNNYCVPAVLSAITGFHVDEIILLIREYLGDQPITGIYYPIALAILQKLGYTYREVAKPAKTGIFLCCNKSHMFVIADNRVYDNGHPDGIPSVVCKLKKCFEIQHGV